MDQLWITLKPRWEDDTVADMLISASFSSAAIEPGGAALDFADQGFGGLVPFPDMEDLIITDENGEVPFHLDSSPTEHGAATYKGVYLERPAAGTLNWSYRIYPRVLPEGYRSSPYYDFRAEPLGLNGSGMFILILPKHPNPLEAHFHWDMSEMPEEARAIWSFGEGDQVLTGNPFSLRFTLFQVGVMQCVEHGGLGVYWFSEPNFDVRGVANKLYPIFEYIKNYFEDPNAGFRVFLRRDPFEISGGGSACPYAFISGYSAYGGMDEEAWFMVLVHEMTHTWPYMLDVNVGEGSWFTEGATEFYCTMLPFTGGFLDAEYTVKRLNHKAGERYYQNVYREMPNMELPKIQWQDRRAQTVPYGRGFVYLANVEAKLRREGKGSIDEIVKGHNICRPITQEDWRLFIRERLGEEGIREFEDMVSGKLLLPEPDLFGPAFETVEEEIELDGKKVVSYHWEVKQ